MADENEREVADLEAASLEAEEAAREQEEFDRTGRLGVTFEDVVGDESFHALVGGSSGGGSDGGGQDDASASSAARESSAESSVWGASAPHSNGLYMQEMTSPLLAPE